MLFRVIKTVSIAICSCAVALIVFFGATALSRSPQLWASLIVATLCFLAMTRAHAVPARMLWWNCGAVFALWALVEAGTLLWIGQRVVPTIPRGALAVRLERLLPDPLETDDPILGTRLVPGVHDREGDALYTINADGLRIGPTPVPGVEQTACVLFLGCSFTFGVGVSDDQTFAYLVQVKTNGEVLTRNFGVGGSAPHYALAQLETGMIERAAHCTPTHAVYLVLQHHAVRVSGKFAVRFGPKYVLQPGGEVIQNGTLNRTTPEFAADVLRYTSTLYVATHGYNAAADPSDDELLVGILRTLHHRLLERYPAIHFDILYWSAPGNALGEQLQTLGIPIHYVANFMPEIEDLNSRAYLGENYHPSPWANERIAEYVVRSVLGVTTDPAANGASR